jgi:hypothetical protein
MLGDDLNESELDTFNDVLDGTMLGRIQDLKDQAGQLNQQIIDMSFTKGVDQSKMQAAKASLLALRNSLNTAVENHNKLAGWIQTATGQNIGLAGYGGMGSLGIIPAIVYTVAAVAGGLIALAIVLDALAGAISAAEGHASNTKGYIEQMADVLGGGAKLASSTSTLLWTTGIIAGVGLVGWVVYRELKKRGKIA